MKTEKKHPVSPPTIRVLTADALRTVCSGVHVNPAIPPHLFRQK
jgi:hypothetical protein